MVQLQSESKILNEDLKNAIKKNKNFALNKGCVRCDAFFVLESQQSCLFSKGK